MRVWGLAVVFVLGSALGAPADGDDSGLRVLRKLYDDCYEKPSPILCLKGKAVTFFDRAARSDSIPVGDLVTLVREGSREDFGRALTDNDVESVVKTSGGVALDELLFDRVARFFNSHSLRLALPKVSSQEIARGYEEGKKIKDKIQYLVLYAIIIILSLL